MNNKELELKVKTILKTSNFFDMVLMAQSFEKDYKASDFYKATKMPLMEVIKLSKVWYAAQFEDVAAWAQKVIDALDLQTINNVVNQIGDVFAKENEDIMSLTENLIEIFKQ